jgi:hypothetical protein
MFTKPFPSSQETIAQEADGSLTIQLKVDLNYEFERLILGLAHLYK